MNTSSSHALRLTVVGLVSILLGCASGGPPLPYPAFVQTDELPDIFIAGFPGTRAKELAYDPRTGSSTHRLMLPPAWKGTIGASPGKSVEMYVVAGDVSLGGIALRAGGYAYVPPPYTAASISTRAGAFVLYFLDDPNPSAVIQTPLFLDADIGNWQAAEGDGALAGLFVKELRSDPGSGARAWLLRVEPGARQTWQKSSAAVEGYLVSGAYQHSECLAGEVVTDVYAPGGYFRRPADTLNGGRDSVATSTAVWFLRRAHHATTESMPACGLTK